MDEITTPVVPQNPQTPVTQPSQPIPAEAHDGNNAVSTQSQTSDSHVQDNKTEAQNNEERLRSKQAQIESDLAKYKAAWSQVQKTLGSNRAAYETFREAHKSTFGEDLGPYEKTFASQQPTNQTQPQVQSQPQSQEAIVMQVRVQDAVERLQTKYVDLKDDPEGTKNNWVGSVASQYKTMDPNASLDECLEYAYTTLPENMSKKAKEEKEVTDLAKMATHNAAGIGNTPAAPSTSGNLSSSQQTALANLRRDKDMSDVYDRMLKNNPKAAEKLLKDYE